MNKQCEKRYVVFCGMDFAGKQQYHDLSVQYVMEEKCVSLNDMSIVSDPSSTDLGKAIVPLDRNKQHFNNTVSGMLYLSASCNVYNTLIHDALEDHNVFCKGYFTEVLGYQGYTPPSNSAKKEEGGLKWDNLKKYYLELLETTHKDSIKYPDLIFFCVSPFEKAKARAQCYNSHNWEAEMDESTYNTYSKKMREACETIQNDKESKFAKKTFLVDEEGKLAYEAWDKSIKPELDKLQWSY